MKKISMKKSMMTLMMIGSVAVTASALPNFASANVMAGAENTGTVATQTTLPSTGTYADYSQPVTDYNYSQPAQTATTPVATNQQVAAPASSTGSAVVAEAMKHLGAPYVWGAKGPDSFDCSGFTHYVYQVATGKEIGGWTVPQESAGTQISVDQAQAGDLLFWGAPGATYHVAISLGNGQFIQAPAPGQGVSISSVADFAPSFAVRVN